MIPFQVLRFEAITAAESQAMPYPTRVVDLLNDARYVNVRYAPSIPARRVSTLASTAPYEDVEDALTVDVVGDSPTQVMDAINALVGIVYQAGDWASGINQPPVWIRARSVLSSGPDWVSLVLGPRPGQSPGSYNPDVEMVGGVSRWVVRNVEIGFVRRGRWIQLVQHTLTGSASVMPTPVQISLPDAYRDAAISPGKWEVARTQGRLFTGSPGDGALRGWFFIASSTSRLHVAKPPSGTNAWGTWTPNAGIYGGGSHTLTLGGPGASHELLLAPATPLTTTTRLVAVWYACTLPGSLVQLSLQAIVYSGVPGGYNYAIYGERIVPSTLQSPVPLGVVAVTGTRMRFGIYVRVLVNPSPGTYTLTSNYLIVQEVDDPCAASWYASASEDAVDQPITMHHIDRDSLTNIGVLSHPSCRWQRGTTVTYPFATLPWSGNLSVNATGLTCAVMYDGQVNNLTETINHTLRISPARITPL